MRPLLAARHYDRDDFLTPLNENRWRTNNWWVALSHCDISHVLLKSVSISDPNDLPIVGYPDEENRMLPLQQGICKCHQGIPELSIVWSCCLSFNKWRF